MQSALSAHLWVGVFAGEVSKVTEDLALHVVFQGGEPVVGLLVHRVVQLQELHQLLRLHLIGQRDFWVFLNTRSQRKDDRGYIISDNKNLYLTEKRMIKTHIH